MTNKKYTYLKGCSFKRKPALVDSTGNIYRVNDDQYQTRLSYAASKETMVKIVLDGDNNITGLTVAKSVSDRECAKSAMGTMSSYCIKEAVKETIKVPEEQAEVMSFIKDSITLRPATMKISDLKWKYLMRSAVRGKNIMMTGPAGCGKTMAAKSVMNSMDREGFYFNLGATQDPRATLIGNTHFNKEDGTYFTESTFVKAIQTEDAVILLDELSRAHPDAWNILMTVLDEGQRYLRLDEHPDSPTVKVAPGVCFIATANIGNEYTSTRMLDRALMDRFIIVEMDMLNKDEEADLLKMLYPNVDSDVIDAIADIAFSTRVEANAETPRISTAISTRATVEMAGLLYDGFDLSEAAQVVVYPQYSIEGGLDSERTYVKQLVQKFIKSDNQEEDLFNADEIDGAETE